MRQGFTTRAVHAGDEANTSRAVAMPLYQTSAFRFDSADEGEAMFAGTNAGDVYSRWGNPNVTELEAKIASLEGGEDGLAAASGMAAIAAVVMTCPAADDNAATATSDNAATAADHTAATAAGDDAATATSDNAATAAASDSDDADYPSRRHAHAAGWGDDHDDLARCHRDGQR